MIQPAASLAIFRAGTHTSVDGRTITFSRDMVRELAESYDPKVSEAPMVIGHPDLNAPAYGWAKNLRVDGDLLYAEPHQVESQFAEGVNAGRYKKISASIYLPDSPGNPKPGKHYLRHIGFLGAAAPAVKGLPSAQFAANDGALEFAQPLGFLGTTLVDVFQRIRDFFVEREGAEAADRIIPQWSIRTIDELTQQPVETQSAPAYADPGTTLEITMSADQTAALAQREQQITTRETAIKARETVIATREATARRTDAASFAATLVQAGKLLPRQQASVVELILALPADTALSFAEGDTTVSKPAGEVLRTLLTDLPKRLDFAEKSADKGAPAAVDFAAPAGVAVDTARSDLHARAKAYQGEHPNTSYVDAVRAVGG